MVEVYLDEESEPLEPQFIEFEESVMRAELPRSPQYQLYILIHTLEGKS